RRIDPKIVSFALDRAPDRAVPTGLDWERKPDVSVDFLKRLSMFAAMAVAAIATARLSAMSVTKREALTHEHLVHNVTLLLQGHEFTPRYSINILNGISEVTSDLIDHGAVTSQRLYRALEKLMTMSVIGEQSYANFYRYTDKNILSVALEIFEGLPVLQKVSISGAGIRIDGTEVEPFPFIYIGDNGAISLLQKCALGNTPSVQLFRGGSTERWDAIPFEYLSQLDRTTKVYGLKIGAVGVLPAPTMFQTAQTTELEPVTRLARALIDGCPDIDDCIELWVRPVLGDRSDDELEYVAKHDKTRVRSCIVKLCLVNDPFSVVERFFLVTLESPHGESRLKRAMKSLYSLDDQHDESIDIRDYEELERTRLLTKISNISKDDPRVPADINTQKARFLAAHFVRRFGFRLDEYPRTRGLVDYFFPAHYLKRYLEECLRTQTNIDYGQTVEALQELSNYLEELIKRLIGFYTCVKYSSLDSPDGVDSRTSERRACDGALAEIKRRHGISALLRLWDSLIHDADLASKMTCRLGFTLDRFPELRKRNIARFIAPLVYHVRNRRAHGQGVYMPTAKETVEHFLDAVNKYIRFLDILLGKLDERKDMPRIFPHVVSLHQVRTNRLGIRSQLYELIREDPTASAQEHQTVALLTPQPVSLEQKGAQEDSEPATLFYAFPAPTDEIPDVWSKPILISIRYILKHVVDDEGGGTSANV
ncbi:MAG: hypothetical protein KKB37_02970, partial [Alphaproteobacteria bacterium]|nr:hypothetical protein [Alphaproteobacteria bacterium]